MHAGQRLFIVDPSLTDQRGHHYTLTRSVTESVRALGPEVLWLSAKSVSCELLELSEIVPTFDLSMYAAYGQTSRVGETSRFQAFTNRVLTRTGLFTQAVPAFAPEPELHGFEAIERSIADGLRWAIAEFDIGAADRLLFHTADGATYRALASVLNDLDFDDLPRIHVCTPYDPVGVMPNRTSAADVAEAINCFRDAGLIDRRVFLYAENPFLAEHLSELWHVPLRTLDLPMRPVTHDMEFVARKFREDRLKLDEKTFLISSLGAARLEKGFNLIPDVIARTFEFAGSDEFPNVSPQSIKFVLQASAQIIGRHPVIEKAIERLRQMPKSQVELLLDPLSDAEYQNLLIGSNAVLMPYDEAAYRLRGSGVVTEAVTARKFIVAKSGSYPARMAHWQGGATGSTPREMAHALVGILDNRWKRFESVRAASDQYLQRNSVNAYARKLVAAERSGMRGLSSTAAAAFPEVVQPL